MFLSPESLQREVEAIAAGAYLADPVALINEALDMLTPPEDISTVDCAEKYRVLPGKEGGSVVRYDRWRTPYNIGPMNWLDDPACHLLVMVKPSRSGGTAICENYVFKIARLGPAREILWVLNSDEEVDKYCTGELAAMFNPDLNPDTYARIDPGAGNNRLAMKRLGGKKFEVKSAKQGTFTACEPYLMVLDESDAYAKRWAASPKAQIDGRQKQLGNQRKAAILSHPDLGWASGVAAAYETTSRGIFVMKCPHCQTHGAAYATKFWDDVPQFRMVWTKNEQIGADERIALARETGELVCPNGCCINEAERHAMIDAAASGPWDGWMHRGQRLDPEVGIIGEPDANPEKGCWVHGTMLKTQSIPDLCAKYQAALIKYERTRDPTELKEFLTKQLCEIFEGAATTSGLTARSLKARVMESVSSRSMAPDWVLFITAAVDPGGRKFDVKFMGWDLLGRSVILDRLTIRQRKHDDGIMRDIHTGESVDDWMVLLPEVLDRRFEITGQPGLVLPVAACAVDAKDGNITWKARAFARRALVRGYHWRGWSKVKLIMGKDGKRPMLPDAPRRIDKDENGRPVEPVTYEYTLGVDRLKELTLERLAVVPTPEQIRDGLPTPGQVFFPIDYESRFIDEYFGEVKVDGKWVRHGPNESLDLFGYNEAVRQMLNPDGEDRIWNKGYDKRPIWARPIDLRLKGGDQSAGGEDIFDLMGKLNDDD